jgi:endosialidase-like protein
MKISNRTAVIVAERGGLFLPPPSLFASDSRLKEAVVPLKQLANGVELYRFRYKGDSEVYVGVIAQQVARLMPRAVLRGDDGYLRVDYERLGLRLMTWAEWRLSQSLPH